MIDVVRLGKALAPQAMSGIQWGIVQSNNGDGTANVRLGGSTTTVVIPYATSYPARPGSKVGVTSFGPDGAITHIVAPSGPPNVRVRKGTAQAIASSTNTVVTLDGTVFTDPWSVFNGTDTFTAPVSGTYLITAGLTFAGAASPAGTRNMFITVNGSAVAYHRDTGTAVATLIPLSVTVALTAGDTVQLYAQHNQGATINVNASTQYDTWMGMTWLGWSSQEALYGPELVVNGDAETLSLANFNDFWGSNVVSSVTTTAGEFASGSAGFKGAGTGTASWVWQGETLSVRPGEVYKISGKYRSSVATSGTPGSSGWIQLLSSGTNDGPNYFGPDVTQTTLVGDTATNTTFKTLSTEWTVPDDIYWIRPSWRFAHTATCNFFLDDLSIVKKDLS